MPAKRVHMPGRSEQKGDAYMLESPLDKNDCFVIRQACVYLLRLIGRYPILDREVLEFAFWVIGPDVAQLNQNLLEFATKREAQRLRDDWDDCLDFEDHARVLMKAVKQDKKKASKLLDSLLQILERRKRQMKSANLSQLKHNSRKFGELFRFMTQMERYQGILICTTNRFQGMDKASVRRFHQKLCFDYLDSEGVQIFYREFLSSLCADPIEPSLVKRLTSLARLTPGDFKNVRDVYSVTEDQLPHESLVSALEEEMRLKENQEGAVRVGF